MKLKIYLLISDWARETDSNVEVEVFSTLAAAQERMRNEFEEWQEDYPFNEYRHEMDDMSATLCMDECFDQMHDVWTIEEKEVDFDDMYIVTKDFVNCYVEDTQQWAGTHEAAVFTKAQADALVKSERDKYNLHGVHGACAFKLINIQSQLVEDYGEDLPTGRP